ncbi:hypothetical protein DXC00_00655 [Ruminococcus sp. OM07-17]|nr:hypothetical protein DXC00_00655 [Ruminococcus sp. OM07-17]
MSKAAPKHRAKREIKRTLKPGARGLVGSRGKALSEFEAEPHSAHSRLGADIMRKSTQKLCFLSKVITEQKSAPPILSPITT